MEEHTEDAHSEEAAARLPVGCSSFCLRVLTAFPFSQVKIAVYSSLIANFALCILQSKPSDNRSLV